MERVQGFARERRTTISIGGNEGNSQRVSDCRTSASGHRAPFSGRANHWSETRRPRSCCRSSQHKSGASRHSQASPETEVSRSFLLQRQTGRETSQTLCPWDTWEQKIHHQASSQKHFKFGANMRKTVHGKRLQILINQLAEGRRNARLTQQELADRLNKPQSFVAKTENGERRLDVIEFLLVAKAIGVDPVKVIRAVQKSIG